MNAEKLKQLQDQVRIGGKVCNVFMQNLTRLNNILTKFRAYNDSRWVSYVDSCRYGVSLCPHQSMLTCKKKMLISK